MPDWLRLDLSLLTVAFLSLAGLLSWMAILLKRSIGAWLFHKWSELLNGCAMAMKI